MLGGVAVWLAPLVALTVGAATALLTGIQLIVGKENKVSEFRQAWIDAQRADLATAIAAAEAHGRADPADRVSRLADFDAAHARVELRENPDVEEWPDVRAALDEMREAMLAVPSDHARLARLRGVVLLHARPTLKANWTVVKRGEPWFVTFKRVYLTLLALIALSATAWMATAATGAWREAGPVPVAKGKVPGSLAGGTTLPASLPSATPAPRPR